jgi:hypothetical protein
MKARLLFAATILGAVMFALMMADGTGWGP